MKNTYLWSLRLIVVLLKVFGKLELELKIDYLGNYLSLLRALLVSEFLHHSGLHAKLMELLVYFLKCFVTWIGYRLTHSQVVDSIIDPNVAHFVT